MATLRKNPFDVFGLTPEITERLDDEELFIIVKAVYRALQKIYHPDRTGRKHPKAAAKAAARAVELNLAYEKLNFDKDPESFQRCHQAHRAKKSRGLGRRVSGLEKEIREAERHQESLAEAFMAYLIRSLPWAAENGAESGRFPPAPANIRLGLNDVAITQNVRRASWTLGSNYKEIVFDALGGMFYRPVGRVRAFPANYIHVLGAIPADQIDLIPILDRVPPREGCFKYPALDSRYGLDGASLQVLNTLPLDKFKKYCLPLLRPEMVERSYLFSMHRPLFEAEQKITIEGVIVKVSRL